MTSRPTDRGFRLVPDWIETPLRVLALVAAVTAAGCLAWLAYEGARAAREVRLAAAEQRAFLAIQTKRFDAEHRVAGEAIANLRDASADVKGLVADVRPALRASLVQASLALQTVAQDSHATAEQATGLLADTRREVAALSTDTRELLGALTLTVRDADGTVREVTGAIVDARAFAEGQEPEIAALIAGTRAIVDDAARARLSERAGATLDASTALLVSVTRSSDVVRERYLQPWTPTAKTRAGRFWQRVGHYTVTVLRTAAGLVPLVRYVPGA